MLHDWKPISRKASPRRLHPEHPWTLNTKPASSYGWELIILGCWVWDLGCSEDSTASALQGSAGAFYLVIITIAAFRIIEFCFTICSCSLYARVFVYLLISLIASVYIGPDFGIWGLGLARGSMKRGHLESQWRAGRPINNMRRPPNPEIPNP